MIISHEKCSIYLSSRRYKLNHNVFITHSYEQLKFKNVDKNVEKLKPEYICGRNVNGTILGITFYFTFTCSGGFVIVSYWCSNFHFPETWALFFFKFFFNLFIPSLCLFLFSVLSQRSLFILNKILSSDICSPNIFWFVACNFILHIKYIVFQHIVVSCINIFFILYIFPVLFR